MMPIRAALVLTALLGLMYAAASVLTSVHDAEIGAAVAAVAVIGYGIYDWSQTR